LRWSNTWGDKDRKKFDREPMVLNWLCYWTTMNRYNLTRTEINWLLGGLQKPVGATLDFYLFLRKQKTRNNFKNNNTFYLPRWEKRIELETSTWNVECTTNTPCTQFKLCCFTSYYIINSISKCHYNSHFFYYKTLKFTFELIFYVSIIFFIILA